MLVVLTKTIFLFLILCISTLLFSQTQGSSLEDITSLNPSQLGNSDTQIVKKTWKNFTDLDYEQGFFELNRKSPIGYDYNEVVQQHIYFYLNNRRDLLSKALGLSKYYFPIFEEMLDKYKLPMELKYLAIVESALNPTAQSKTGAIGLWQFKYNTAKMMDLVIDNYVDERQDPIKSTEAACKYLDFLFNTFGDWQLALASYNGGPGTVRNAVARSNGKSQFWELRPFLPTETKGYVPAFLAISYLLENAEKFDIVADVPKIMYHQVDTVMIHLPVYFQKISSNLDIPLETIRFLNPSYKKNYIPLYDNPVPLILPETKIPEFIRRQDIICEKTYPTSAKSNEYSEPRMAVTHVVEKGDFMNKIALEYRCSIDDIVKWNQLDGFSVHAGQNLIIWVPESLAQQRGYKKSASEKVTTGTKKLPISYKIQKGDTLYSIAAKYQGVTVDEIRKLNNFTEDYVLLPGSEMQIPVP